jgi:hypothetical protein
VGEHVCMFPVDTIKTRMQALAHPGQQVSCCSSALDPRPRTAQWI